MGNLCIKFKKITIKHHQNNQNRNNNNNNNNNNNDNRKKKSTHRRRSSRYYDDDDNRHHSRRRKSKRSSMIKKDDDEFKDDDLKNTGNLPTVNLPATSNITNDKQQQQQQQKLSKIMENKKLLKSKIIENNDKFDAINTQSSQLKTIQLFDGDKSERFIKIDEFTIKSLKIEKSIKKENLFTLSKTINDDLKQQLKSMKSFNIDNKKNEKTQLLQRSKSKIQLSQSIIDSLQHQQQQQQWKNSSKTFGLIIDDSDKNSKLLIEKSFSINIDLPMKKTLESTTTVCSTIDNEYQLRPQQKLIKKFQLPLPKQQQIRPINSLQQQKSLSTTLSSSTSTSTSTSSSSSSSSKKKHRHHHRHCHHQHKKHRKKLKKIQSIKLDENISDQNNDKKQSNDSNNKSKSINIDDIDEKSINNNEQQQNLRNDSLMLRIKETIDRRKRSRCSIIKKLGTGGYKFSDPKF